MARLPIYDLHDKRVQETPVIKRLRELFPAPSPLIKKLEAKGIDMSWYYRGKAKH